MADTKISQLPEATSLDRTDIIPVVINPGTAPENRKVEVKNVLTVPTSRIVLVQQSTTPSAQSGKNVLFADTSNKLKYVKPNSNVEELTTQSTFQTEHNADGTHLKATGAEVNAGIDDTKIVTPKAIADSDIQSGWTSTRETWTFASASDPNFDITVSGDKTSKYSKGMKVKLTQATGGLKYFIITAVSYSNPNTTITLYGGTDYDLVNEAISNNYYSVSKAPVGFPPDLTKWTIFQAVQSTLVNSSNNTIVDITGTSLTLPAGTYKINAHFFGRAWSNPTNVEINVNMYGELYNQTSSTTITNSIKSLRTPDFDGLKEIFLDFTTIQTFTSLTTIKLRGYINLFGYTNFASGFRWDSSPASLDRCRIIAERIDLSI